MISTYIVCGSYLLFPLFPKPLPSIGQCEDGLRYCTIACKKKAASSTRCLCKCQFFERLQPISEIEGVLNPTHLHFSYCCQFPFLAKVHSLFLKAKCYKIAFLHPLAVMVASYLPSSKQSLAVKVVPNFTPERTPAIKLKFLQCTFVNAQH